jgi:hypothetical protein
MINYQIIGGRLAMGLAARLSRQKISTTISSDSLSYLERLIEKGEARTLADAIDFAVQKLLTYENRERLANDTAAYFERMSPEGAEEEARLGAALAGAAQGIDFDREP